MAENRDSRAFLQRLTFSGAGNGFPATSKAEYDRHENVELNLGLSLNGKFGLNPEKTNKSKLFRASSDFVNFAVDVELSLSRTCSLPPDKTAELRKRKELQSVRRSEVKRKRLEKLKQLPPSPPQPISIKFSSQGSIVSQGSGGSSGLSDLDSQPFSGVNKGISQTNESSEPNKVQRNMKTKPKVHCAMDTSMPCVSTKGDGPDGKRIQGFLYRYGKGEEVRIVCVCHGSFLTPAEFVKHGGGGDVDHPLRHIVVTSSLFS